MPPNSSGPTNDPSQPSAMRPIRCRAGVARPPSQNSSLRRRGSGVSAMSVSDQKRPRRVTGSPVQSAFRIATDSSSRSARSPRATPSASSSPGAYTPSPPAGSSRPFESTSTLASSRASSSGLRGGITSTFVPSLSRSVRAADCGEHGQRREPAAPSAVAQPERVVADPLERVDHPPKAAVGDRLGTEADQPDADPDAETNLARQRPWAARNSAATVEQVAKRTPSWLRQCLMKRSSIATRSPQPIDCGCIVTFSTPPGTFSYM